jgi:hypothetical protein
LVELPSFLQLSIAQVLSTSTNVIKSKHQYA